MKAKKWLLAVFAIVLVLSLVAAVACKKNEDKPELPTEGPETGVYYYDDLGNEYVIALNGGNLVSFLVKGANKSGTYTLDGTTLTFTFADGTTEATYSDGKIKLNYNNSEMEFLLKRNYTVTFDSCGGSAVDGKTVLNGKTISAPHAPTRQGYYLVGWYTDQAHTTPFMFDAQAVTADITLYAYWLADNPTADEYFVDFNLGYEGAQAIASQRTVSGALATLPTPAARSGYTFGGWFVSDYESADKLTSLYTAGTLLSQDTPLFALWIADGGSKLATPVASANAQGISWQAVDGATGYTLTIDGDTISLSASETSYAFATQLSAGEHIATVTALGATSAQNSQAAVRYIAANALSRVSLFNVIDGFLTFKGVANATAYYIDVTCGNSAHNHSHVALGNGTSYNFANCAMTADGISFTVTATADGYVSSVSRKYVYTRALAAIDELYFDEATEIISWASVADAQSYVVAISADAAHSHTLLNIGNTTSFDLSSCGGDKDGNVTFAVYPVTNGYVSPAAKTYTYKKTNTPTVDGLNLVGNTLSWNAVSGATYEVSVNGSISATSETSLDLSALTAEAQVAVRAIVGSAAGSWSNTLTVKYFAAPDGLNYANGTLSWNGVFGAATYDVKVNDGETLSTNGTSLAVALDKSGVNTLSVRTVPQTGDATAWTSITVYAHEITLNVNGGSAVDNSTLYLLTGDTLTLPETTRDEYDLAGWYNAKCGASGNAKLYTSGLFLEGADITLYADWTGKQFEITYDLGVDDATIAAEKASVKYGENYTLLVPSREGYVFDGWYADAELTNRITDGEGHSLAAWATADNATLHAAWIQVLAYELQSDGNYYVTAGADIDSVTEVTVPQTYKGKAVVAIYDGAFKNCRNLQVVNFYDTIQTIGVTTDVVNGPFAGCENLREVNVIPSGVDNPVYYSVNGSLVENEQQTGLKALVFVSTYSDGEFTVPDGVQRIPGRLFANAKFRKITIPTSVEEIGENAFFGCANLNSVQFVEAAASDEVKALKIGNNAFRMCESLRSISLPSRVGEFDAESVFERCTALTDIQVASGNEHYASVDGILTNETGNTMLYFPYGRSGAITLPESIKAIGAKAFANRTKITGITIRETIETIGDYAFSGCSSLYSVDFAGSPIGVGTAIGSYAFADCAMLTNVKFAAQSKVATIGTYAFANDKNIVSVELPKSLTMLSDYAFSGCGGLRNVTLSSGKASSIGSFVFDGCTSLDTINLSESVTEIALNAFAGCEKLTTINVAEANTVYASLDGVLYNKAMTSLIYCSPRNQITAIPDTVTEICDGAFATNGIKSLTIGANVTSIGANAFYKCAALAELTFQEGRTAALTIGANAFELCSSLGAVALPDTTTSVGESAFAKTGITTLSVPASVTSVGAGAFADCVVLATANFAANITALPDNLFANCAKLASVTLSDGLTSIGEHAFDGASMLANLNATDEHTVNLPSALATIGAFAFNGTSLAELTVPQTVTTIGEGAFANNAALTSLTFVDGEAELAIASGSATTGVFAHTSVASLALPARLTTLGNYAFANTKLASLSFAANGKLTAIGDYAFSYALTASVGEEGSIDIALPEGITSVGAHAFENGKINTLTLPASLATLGDNAFAAQSELTSATFTSGNASVDLAIGNYAFGGDGKLESLTLSDSLKTIGTDAFSGCSSLAAFTFGAQGNAKGFETEEGGGILYAFNLEGGSKTIINFYVPAAYNFGTETFRLPDGVTAIPANAFYGSDIVSVDLTGITSIGEGAFRGTNIAQITLPDGLKEIGAYAFYGTKLSALTIPVTVTTIGDYAFAGITYTETTTVPSTEEGGESTTVTETHNGPSTLTFAKLANQDNYTALTIGANAFANAGLTAVELPKRLIALGANAFDGNSALATLTFEADRIVTAGGVTTDITLGNQAFKGTAITSAELPEGLTRIPSELFGSYTDTLKSIVIPSTVTEVGPDAFKYNTSLADVTFASGGADALMIAESAFYNTALTTIELPARTSIIGQYAFRECKLLASVTFENGGADSKLETVADYAFNNSGSEVDEFAITLPDTVKTIGRSAFDGSSLHTFRMPASLTDIYPSQFDSSFYYAVFKNCNKLTTIDIGKLALSSFSAKTFAGCLSITDVIVDVDNTAYSAKDGVLFDKNGETLVYYPAGKTATEYTIPDSVITIAERAFSRENSEGTTDMNKHLTAITFGKNVQTVGDYAFANMATLTSIDFTQNNSLTTIGLYSICGTSISELTIPGSVTTIGIGSFYNSKLLRSLTFAEGTADLTIGDRTFESMGCNVPDIVGEELTTEVPLAALVIPARVTTIGYNAFGTVFNANKALTEVTFESGSRLTAIGNNAFFNQKFTSFVLPEDVATIGENAFQNTPLTSFTFNNSVATIGANAFNGTSALTEVTIPSSVTSIGNYAFLNSGLTKVTFQQNAALTLGNNIFAGCASLASITLPQDLTALGNSMLSGCSALTQITLPQSLTTIADSALSGTSLTSVKIPSNVTEIGANAFSGITTLTNVDFSEATALTKIGDGAFQGCSAITSLSLPHNLESIGANAFSGITSLTSVEFVDSSLQTIGSGAFANCTSLANIELPAYLNSLAADAFSGCTALDLAVSRYNTDFVMRDGILYNRDTTSILYISPAKLVGKITIMDGVETIADKLFSNATQLTEVVLPDSVNSIGANAFDGCSGITSIVLPKYLETIGAYAFRGTNITSVNIPATTTFVGNYAFYGISTLTSLTFEKGGTTALSLGNYAFYGTSITELVIPARMRNYTATVEDLFYGFNKLPGIGNYCFKDCLKLKTVTYEKDVVTDIPGVLSFGISAFSSGKMSSGKVNGKGTQMNIETIELPSFVGTDSWEYSQYGSTAVGYLKAFGNGCFASQSALKSFVFEKSDCDELYVGNYLFAYSSDIGTVVLPDNLAMLNSESRPYKDPINSTTNYRGSGRFMFQSCTALESVTLGDADVSNLFSGVKSTLKSIALTGENGEFYENVYGFSALQKLFIHNITSEVLSSAASFGGTLYTDLAACPDGLDTTTWNQLIADKKLVHNTTLAEFNAIPVE